MATYTCSDFNEVPKGGIPGVVSRTGQFVWTAASSNGDVCFLTKIPHGAVIVDLKEDHSTGATTQALSFGLTRGGAAGGGANLSLFIASGAQATVNRMQAAGTSYGWQVSVSDLDPLRYGELTAKVESGTATTSLVVNFTVLYRVDKTPD